MSNVEQAKKNLIENALNEICHLHLIIEKYRKKK